MLPSLGLVKFPTWRVRRSAESLMGSSILGWSAAPPRGHNGRRLDQGLRSDVFGHKIGVLPQAIAGPLDLHHHGVMEQAIQKSRRHHGIAKDLAPTRTSRFAALTA